MPLKTAALTELSKFLFATLTPPQLSELIDLLKAHTAESITTLDPEDVRVRNKSMLPAPALQQIPAGLADLLREIDAAYSIDKFPALSTEEARRLREMYPGLSERIAAFQGRHLVKMLRDRLRL